MIPVILKGETSKPIQLALREGYVYTGCALHVDFCGVKNTFIDLDAGGSVELRYSAEQTARFPLGTSKVALSIENALGEICFMPWAKIKVTDSPDEVHDAQIIIDPATLNVTDATSKDSLAAVKSKLNAVLAFLRGLSSLAVLALPLYALSDVAPLYSAFEDIPGDEQVVTNVVPYVEAKIAEASADLTPATNYTDRVLGAFASTGAVARATVYGTPTRLTDATGCVWEVMLNVWVDHAEGNVFRGGTSIFPSEVEGVMRGYLYYDPTAMEYVGGTGGGWYYNGDNSTYSPLDVFAGGPDATSLDNGRFTFGNFTNLVGRVALTNDLPDVSGYATQQQATNAATAVADAKISTNNAAFVEAVTNCPVVIASGGGGGADWPIGDFGQYGGYGTVGAALLALIAGLAALKRRMATAETALAQKANASDLPYRLVEPGKWEFGELPSGVLTVDQPYWDESNDAWELSINGDAPIPPLHNEPENAMSLEWEYEGSTITATRASLPGHLCDRAGNRVVVSGDTTLTLPDANPGYIRDFLVRLEISGSTVPTITFAASTGETITYETDGDELPVPDEAGDWLYSFTESCVAHKFAVSLKKVNEVAAPQTQGGS